MYHTQCPAHTMSPTPCSPHNVSHTMHYLISPTPCSNLANAPGTSPPNIQAADHRHKHIVFLLFLYGLFNLLIHLASSAATATNTTHHKHHTPNMGLPLLSPVMFAASGIVDPDACVKQDLILKSEAGHARLRGDNWVLGSNGVGFRGKSFWHNGRVVESNTTEVDAKFVARQLIGGKLKPGANDGGHKLCEARVHRVNVVRWKIWCADDEKGVLGYGKRL